jgi:hypothetical protein
VSRVTIFQIANDGIVSTLASVHNAMAYCPVIWDTLGQKLLGRRTTICADEDLRELWAKFEDPTVSEDDRIMLALTFDAIWIRRDRCIRTATAMLRFWQEHSYPQLTPTIVDVADQIQAASALDIRGVCFQGTSVSDCAWWVHDACDKCGQDLEEARPFNFDKDKFTAHGNEPWELFAVLEQQTP